MIARQGNWDSDRPAYEDVAELLHLLSLPARLRIIDMLRHREECVCALQKALGRPQPYVSQQLRVLRKAGIVEWHRGGRRAEGDERYVYYRLADPWVRQLVEAALGPADPAIVHETGPPVEGEGCAALGDGS